MKKKKKQAAPTVEVEESKDNGTVSCDTGDESAESEVTAISDADRSEVSDSEASDNADDKEETEDTESSDTDSEDEDDDPEQASHKAKRAKKKKRLLTVISVICGITLVLLILHYFGIINLDDPFGDDEPERIEIELWRLSIPDWDTDIFTLESYLEKPRYINYKTLGAQTIGLVDGNYSGCSDGVELLAEYIDALMHGDHEKVNAMHTDEWLYKYGAYEEFTMQKIYEITIEHLREYVSTDEKGNYIRKFDYKVSYKIMKNDGTFRKDIYSDGIRPIYFEIIDSNGTMKINRTEYSYWNLPKE